MKFTMFAIAAVVVLSASSFLGANVGALEVPKAPSLDKPIVDKTKTLTDQQIGQLSDQINNSRLSKSYQLGILMIPSLEDESLEDYSLTVAREWGIGEEDTNNGVLFLIVKDDRVMRLEVGRGLEGDLTDARSRRIIDNAVAPHFRNSNYYQGIQAGVSEIHSAVMGRPETSATTRTSDTSGGVEGILTFVMTAGAFIFTWLASVLGRSKSWWAGGLVGGIIGLIFCFIFSFTLIPILALIALVFTGFGFDYVVSKNYKKHSKLGDSMPWWIGGSGGGFGGGSSGGGGFGGGNFGGGGASGRW